MFCHEQTLPTGPEVQGPHLQPTPSQLCSEASIGTGAGFARVQPSGAKSCALVIPSEGCFRRGVRLGREGGILWSQEKCGRTGPRGYLSRLLPPSSAPSRRLALFLPEAGATMDCTGSKHFLEASSGISTKQGHHPCKTTLSNSLASFYQLLVMNGFVCKATYFDF